MISGDKTRVTLSLSVNMHSCVPIEHQTHKGLLNHQCITSMYSYLTSQFVFGGLLNIFFINISCLHVLPILLFTSKG